MKGKWWPIFLLMILGCGIVIAESLPLPVWTKEDRSRLLAGELITGNAILVEDPEEIPLPQVVEAAEEPIIETLEPVAPVPDYDPVVIPRKFLPVYFSSVPDVYLMDPQGLLSRQEAIDREGFLQYHADDSELDIRMYLFDALQQLPEPYTIQKLCQDQFSGGPLTAVVFCFLGDPTRTQIAFGGDGAAQITPYEIRKILESAKIKAMEKSDPSAQIESFIVQLSIRLYWLERERARQKAIAAVQDGRSNAEDGADATGLTGGAGKQRGDSPVSTVRSYAPYMVAGLIGVLSLGYGLWLVWSIWVSTRRYHFPVFEIPERLGANYAAGVGAVIAFHSKLGSPSSQRDQVPDYLRRI
jgi:hypothetical protein